MDANSFNNFSSYNSFIKKLVEETGFASLGYAGTGGKLTNLKRDDETGGVLERDFLKYAMAGKLGVSRIKKR
ncbi:MAG: hypothetical protein GX219_06730 [Tissierellia bacterium]|nr:hypothetical protein [Tissierellia bacterium]